MSNKSFYITTPIYYVNGEPHLGHAYTTIAADVLARYNRQSGVPTFLMTGTDEHGQKVEEAANKAGETPKQFADKVSKMFSPLWDKLNISLDHFIRTTDEDHKEVVSKVWKMMADKGDIYLGEYEDYYCVHDETFWKEGQLLEGNLCPNPWCKRPVEKRKEKSYFFKLSKYQEPLLEYFEKHPDFVLPDYRMNEVRSFVQGGLQDLSISRTSFSWGIPVPEDPKHVVYVWVDALYNYVSGIGYSGDKERYEKFWPANVHLIGKDILRFHAIYWPAFLMSAGLPLPKHIFAHGFWNVEGQKMSKSLGNWVDPNEIVDTFGLDSFRYYLMREIQLGPDGDFSRASLIGRINSDLANDLGNLLSRSASMAYKFSGGKAPKPTSQEGNPVAEKCMAVLDAYHKNMQTFKTSKALGDVWSLISTLNRYIDDQAPWVLAKDESKHEQLQGVMYNLLESLRQISIMIQPFMPDSSVKMLAQLGIDEPVFEFENNKQWGLLPEGTELKRGKPLFPRLDPKMLEKADEKDDKQAAKEDKKSERKDSKKDKKAAKELPEGVIEFGDFTKVQLKVGKVLEAEKVEGADKLLKLKVDTGEERTIVAGIAQHYKAEEMVGKNVVVVANLNPRKLRGILSEGMLLAATQKDGKLAVVTTDGPIEGGSRVG